MNVLVLIDGREAIPVRAIPLLTNWEKLSPDLIAEILGECDESDHYEKFKGLRARRIERDTALPIQPGHWRNFVARDLRALSHRIKSNQITHEDGHSRWRRESIEALPEGAFVWRDEFEARFWATFDKGGYVVREEVGGRLQERVQPAEVDLNYAPFVPASTANLVMEGFASLEPHETAKDEAAFHDGFDSVRLGHELEAEHWVTLPVVQAKHAAMLITGINPTHYPDPDQRAPSYADLPKYRTALNTFESYGHDGIKRSLRDWVALAQSHGLQIDVRVLATTEKTVVPSSAGSETASASDVGGVQRQGACDSQDAAIPAEQEIAFKVLAMPDKLLSVFGGFGLQASQFKKLQGPLQRAQKVPGKPGRGGYPGWFCPYEVMTWLAKSKRNRMSEETGWRLLEGHFEATYAKFSIADPRTDDH